MSNDGLSTDEKVNLLFKNYMNFTSTLDSKPFYDETAVANNTNIFSNSVLSKMPSTNPSWTAVNTHQELKSLLENAGISINIDATWFDDKTSKTNSSLGAKFEHSENRALRLTRIKLDYVTNGGASFICKDKYGTNILQNLIPSNYAQNGYSLDLEYKRPSDNAIKTIGWLVNRTELAGNVYVGQAVNFGGALFDSKNGVITFYDVNGNASSIFSSAEFYLTATKYIGPKLTDSDGNLYIDANVGIGTDNPSEVLDVNGSIRIRKGNDLYIGDSIWDSLRFKHEGSGATGYNYIDYNNNSSIMFRVTNYPSSVSTTMTLDKDGNVGIGTNDPQYLLDLYNDTGDIMFQIRDDFTKLHIGTEESSHAFIGVTSDDDLRFKTNNTDRMVINNVGNVGIGTTDPQKLLDLSDKFSNGFRLGETLRSSIIDVANPGALTGGYNTASFGLASNEFSWTRGAVNSSFGNIAITYLSRPGDYLKFTMKVKSSSTSTYFYIQNPSYNNLLKNAVTVGSTTYVEKTFYVTIPDDSSFYSYFQIYGPDLQIKDFKIERIDMTLGGRIASTMAIVPPSNTQKFRALSLYNRNTSLHNSVATNYHFYVYDINNNSDDGNTKKMEICYDVDEDNTLMVFDGVNGNVGIGKMSAYPLDVTGGSRNRLLEQVGTYKIHHYTSESGNRPLNLFHNSNDMGSLWQNRNNIDYIAFPLKTGDILYTHTIAIHSYVTGSTTEVEYYKLQLRNAATGGYVDQTKFPIDSYHTIIAYKKKQDKPVIIEGDTGVDISSSDPSYENYSQLSIQSISGTVHENIMALKIGADHKTNTGYLQTVNKFINASHLVLQPYAGNVGIGTTIPSEALDVGGSIRCFNSSVGNFITFKGDADYTNLIGERHVYIKANGKDQSGVARNDGQIIFVPGTGVGEKARINKDGNLGIGTDNPSANLHVKHDFHIAANSSDWGSPGKGLYIRYSTTTGTSQDEAYIQSIDRSNYPTSVARHPLYFEASKYNFSNGDVGIGTTAPIAPLHVKAGTSRSLTGGYYFNTTTTFGAYGTQQYVGAPAGGSAINESIFAEGGITSEQGFYADSDSRIKTNISDINDESALTKLREIEPKTYQYIDTIKRNNVTVYGFIAQQIKEVLPKAVTFQNRTIPSIFELCNATSSSNNEYYDTIHFTDFNTANLDASSNNIVIVDANNKNQSVNILSVLDSSNVQVDTNLSEWMAAVDASGNVTPNEVQKYEKVILDANNIVVLENYDVTAIASMDASDNVVGKMADLSGGNTIDSSNNYVDASGTFIAAVNPHGHYIDVSGNYFDTNGNFMDASNNLVGTYKTEWKKVIINGTKIFVYGQNVGDFHVLQKEYIFTVATAALQEMDRQLQAEKAKTATLESQVADLLARVTALESV